MNVLVVGSGGREHALVWKIRQSPQVGEVFCAPGNPGIAQLAECVNIQADDLPRLAEFAVHHQVDLTVVGPEGPLALGIVDEFEARGLKVFGPRKNAAVLEGSKAFAKEFMQRHGIPSAGFRVFSDAEAAQAFVKQKGRCVVKADGLAAGKGVYVCQSAAEALAAVQEILVEKRFGDAGNQVIVEDLLEGQEVSVLAFCDGKTARLMVSAQDHKRVFDGDQGPNTGGMGAYSPAPFASPEFERRVHAQVIARALEGMAKEGRAYKGVLYAGLMVSGTQVKVLEFNCRFGDPETQVILPRLETDLVEVALACIEGRLDAVELRWGSQPCCCVVLASKGYPAAYEKGKEISGLERAGKQPNTLVFHAGTSLADGKTVSSGGRVLGVTALGKTIREAIGQAYQAVALIYFEGMHFRRDIGKAALPQSGGH
ncbi:MAG: phosphoribosylamine--glycine ligase [Candidatus Diapherotrites archaeon]|uniref:Phosphoribosylamine--glycine ligase n=1 Tax=Candidatus Iainarchaeum sp. TaxID=3101447 RepID=A0A8T4L879_9ARCH|nr:phosphoribosylamine--glycine ligase [Candidatus Diapherotrites archaeon]